LVFAPAERAGHDRVILVESFERLLEAAERQREAARRGEVFDDRELAARTWQLREAALALFLKRLGRRPNQHE
jgi:hypothetical protein